MEDDVRGDRIAPSSLAKLTKFLGSNAMHISIGLVGGLLNFLPVITGQASFIESAQLRESIIDGILCVVSSTVMLTLVFPLAIDRFWDILQSMSRPKSRGGSSISTEHANFMSHTEVFVVLLGFVISSGTVFATVNSTAGNACLLNMCARRCRGALVICGTAASFARNMPQYWRGIPMTLTLTFNVLTFVLGTYSVNFPPLATGPAVNAVLSARNISQYLAFAIFYVMSFSWIYYTWIHPRLRLNAPLQRMLQSMGFLRTSASSDRRDAPVTNTKGRPGSTHNPLALPSGDANITGETGRFAVNRVDAFGRKPVPEKHASKETTQQLQDSWYKLAFLSVSLASFTIIIAMSAVIGGAAANYTPVIIFINDMSYALLVLGFLVLTPRKSKSEIVKGLVALLDARKRYIRYLSHELRTPLNSCVLGLQLLIREFSLSTDPRDADMYDTTIDLEKSILAAVAILDNLLLFDKLESGLLELKKQKVPAIDFLAGCVTPFRPQARESGVQLHLVTAIVPTEQPENRGDGNSEQSLEDSDFVDVDPLKMAQVIRNLVSNALKFCPRETGVITVRAVFVPRANPGTARSLSRKSIVNQRSEYDLGAADSRRSSKAFVKGGGGSFRLKPDAQSNFRRRSLIVHADSVQDVSATDSVSDTTYGVLKITVTDNGVGLSHENQKRLFKEIVQFDPEILQAGGGSGFGLLIAKGIVEEHQSHIHVFSEGEGKGTTFTVEIPMIRSPSVNVNNLAVSLKLNGNSGFNTRRGSVGERLPYECEEDKNKAGYDDPESRSLAGGGAGSGAGSVDYGDGAQRINVYPVSSSYETLSGPNSPKVKPPDVLAPINGSSVAAANTASSAANAASAAAAASPRYKILIVDDSETTRKMLRKTLTAAGHMCEEAEDGLVAVEKVQLQLQLTDDVQYDCILMDFVMPNMDGPTASRKIRELGYTKPIFGVTGNTVESDMEEFLRSGVDKVFPKPFHLGNFHAAMKGQE